MNTTTKAWLIDLDGTLYHSRPVQMMMALELVFTGWSSWPTIRRFRHSHEQLRAICNSPEAIPIQKSCFERQLTITANAMGLSEESVENCIEKWMIRRPGKWIRIFRRRSLISEISAFRSKGGKSALVSDYPAHSKLRSMGIAELFDVVVANGEKDGQQRLKPDPEGFLLAAQRLDVPPSACLVIGDRNDADGQAARRAQMKFRLIR